MSQNEGDIHSEFSCSGGDLAAPVGLGIGSGYQHINVLSEYLRQEKFQLTCFVAAESKTGHIITLDEDPWTTQFLTQFWAFIQGSREMRQMDSRNRIQPRRQFRMSELFLVQEILSLCINGDST